MNFKSLGFRCNSTKFAMNDWVKANPTAVALVREYQSALGSFGYDRRNTSLGELYSLALILQRGVGEEDVPCLM